MDNSHKVRKAKAEKLFGQIAANSMLRFAFGDDFCRKHFNGYCITQEENKQYDNLSRTRDTGYSGYDTCNDRYTGRR